MATERTISNPPVREQIRLWRMTIETPRNGRYYVEVHKQSVQLDAQGEVVGTPVDLPSVILYFDEIASKMLSSGATNRAVGTITPFIVDLADKAEQFAQEVQDARAAAAAASQETE